MTPTKARMWMTLACLAMAGLLIGVPVRAEEDRLFSASSMIQLGKPGEVKRVVLKAVEDVEVVAVMKKKIVPELIKHSHEFSPESARKDAQDMNTTLEIKAGVAYVEARGNARQVDKQPVYTLRVPAGMPVEVETNGRAVTCLGPLGNLKVTTNGGNVTVDGARGSLDLETHAADIVIRTANVPVKAVSDSGKITFTGALPKGEHTFATRTEPVTLNLPARSSFAVNAEVRTGKINSEFNLAVESQKDEVVVAKVGPAPKTQLILKGHDIYLNKIR